ncbi:hypothetical protein ASZ78_010280 [Callipepla squamata]|uniref:Golgi associated RAB2 interactor protein-like Rab2B-binding domain-containing protein n=1 Tax=Callipepla squamata TaxID=9009 RepID=A0A226NHY2_CALSU|nr:hypothetical protein ASZ78_010280 [Callipepla squamata]
MSHEIDFKKIILSQKSITDDLRKLLNQGEYDLFASAPMFESRFVQINQRGELIDLHNRPACVTVGMCAASSPMPSGILLARKEPVSPLEIMENLQKFPEHPPQVEKLALTRFFPLKFVELSVHSTDKQQLMLKLVNGRSYYLQLCAPPDQQQQLFHYWSKLISLLKSPKNTSNTNINIICKDSGMSREKAPSPSNPTENSMNPQNVPNPKTEEAVTEQASSNQVPCSDSVSPTEKRRRERATFNSSQQATRQETTTQSKNIDLLHANSKSKERRKSR